MKNVVEIVAEGIVLMSKQSANEKDERSDRHDKID